MLQSPFEGPVLHDLNCWRKYQNLRFLHWLIMMDFYYHLKPNTLFWTLKLTKNLPIRLIFILTGSLWGFNINVLYIMLQFLATGFKDRFKGVCLDKKAMPMIHKSLAYCRCCAVNSNSKLSANCVEINLLISKHYWSLKSDFQLTVKSNLWGNYFRFGFTTVYDSWLSSFIRK